MKMVASQLTYSETMATSTGVHVVPAKMKMEIRKKNELHKNEKHSAASEWSLNKNTAQKDRQNEREWQRENKSWKKFASGILPVSLIS